MKKMKTSEGAINANPPAKRKGSGESFSAAKTSFQDSTNVKMLEAARPGSASGSATRQNAPTGVQPSVSAASSRSPGTATKILLVIKTVVGSASAVWTSATPSSESYRPHWMKLTASGIDRMTIGKARVARIRTLNA